MKIILLSIVFISLRAFSSERFFIESERLNAPYYESLDSLYLQTDKTFNEVVKLTFLDDEGRVEGISNERIRVNEEQDCNQIKCKKLIKKIPTSLKKYTCKIKIETKNTLGNVTWGKCEKSVQKPSDRFLANFTVSENSFFTTDGVIEVENKGSSVVSEKLEVWAIIRDENNNIIWRGISKTLGSFGQGQLYEVQFPQKIKNMHIKLGCRVEIVLDPYHQILEKNKLDNDVEIMFGECLRTPQFESGDRVDFIPQIERENEWLKVIIENTGTLSFENVDSRINSIIEYFNEFNELVWSQSIFFVSPLYGFGDKKEVFREKINSNQWCKIRITVNPHFIFKESNYLNNKHEDNFCL